MGKGKLKKAFMYTRITPWMQPQSCLDKRDAIKSFLERNGYAYNQKMGRVVIGTTVENFNDMNSWQFLLQLSEMKPIAQGAECLIVYTLDDLSKSKSVAKEMVDIIKAMGLDFKTTDGSEIQLETKEESVFPEFVSTDGMGLT